MDIYSFINSSAIRKHLKDMDYKFNTLEAAWLVFRSMDTTVEERHRAWMQIVDTMPDCELPERNNTVHQDSVHEFLKRYIGVENDVLKKFHQPDDKAIYRYKFYCDGDVTWCEDYESAYATEEECWDMIAEDMDLGIHSVKIKKMGLGKDAPSVIVEFKPDKSVVCIQGYGLLADEDKAIIDESFEGLWFDFPIPFKKGDVLAKHIPDYPFRAINRPYPFVMAGATPLEAEERKKRILEYGDNTDMNAWGWFQEEDGRIFHEVMANYMDLEYYDGLFEGVTRLLKAISSYIKKEIPLDLLLTCYRKVILDEITRDMNLNMYLDKDIEAAGLRNIVLRK